MIIREPPQSLVNPLNPPFPGDLWGRGTPPNPRQKESRTSFFIGFLFKPNYFLLGRRRRERGWGTTFPPLVPLSAGREGEWWIPAGVNPVLDTGLEWKTRKWQGYEILRYTQDDKETHDKLLQNDKSRGTPPDPRQKEFRTSFSEVFLLKSVWHSLYTGYTIDSI